MFEAKAEAEAKILASRPFGLEDLTSLIFIIKIAIEVGLQIQKVIATEFTGTLTLKSTYEL